MIGLQEVMLTEEQINSLSPEQYKDHFTVPTTYEEAWNHPCPFQQKNVERCN